MTIDGDLPGVEDDLLPLATFLLLELKVVSGPSALSFGKICDEVVVILGFPRLIHDDFRDVLVEREDNVFKFLVPLECHVSGDTLLVDANSGGLLWGQMIE